MSDKIYVSIDDERFEAEGEILEALKITQNELKQNEENAAKENALKQAIKAELLAKLGITEEEAKILLS